MALHDQTNAAQWHCLVGEPTSGLNKISEHRKSGNGVSKAEHTSSQNKVAEQCNGFAKAEPTSGQNKVAEQRKSGSSIGRYNEGSVGGNTQSTGDSEIVAKTEPDEDRSNEEGINEGSVGGNTQSTGDSEFPRSGNCVAKTEPDEGRSDEEGINEGSEGGNSQSTGGDSEVPESKAQPEKALSGGLGTQDAGVEGDLLNKKIAAAGPVPPTIFVAPQQKYADDPSAPHLGTAQMATTQQEIRCDPSAPHLVQPQQEIRCDPSAPHLVQPQQEIRCDPVPTHHVHRILYSLNKKYAATLVHRILYSLNKKYAATLVHRILYSLNKKYAATLVHCILYSLNKKYAATLVHCILYSLNKKYAATLVHRILYSLNRNRPAGLDNGKLSYRELRRGDLLEALQLLDQNDDINQFWELDKDHDFLIDKDDLAHYSQSALSYQIVDRIFEQVPRRFTSNEPGKMGYEDFVWFILSEEDKSSDTAIGYWFKAADLDCDGVIRPREMWAFYEEQLKRLRDSTQEPVLFEDMVCQMHDMLAPAVEGAYTRRDLIRVCTKLAPTQPPHHPPNLCTERDLIRVRTQAGLLFNALFNLHKFLGYENRDPFAQRNEQAEFGPMTDWQKFARIEYSRLASEDDQDVAMEAEEGSWPESGATSL
eukprot:gene10859-16974_t